MPKDIAYSDPAVDNETRSYWEGAARDELVLQRCGKCGVVQHRPRAQCAKCLSPDIEHFVARGTGTLHTWTVTHQNLLPPFAPACPYVMAYVDLDEGPRLLTNVVGCPHEQLRIGMPLRVEFVKTGEFAVPRFRPA